MFNKISQQQQSWFVVGDAGHYLSRRQQGTHSTSLIAIGSVVSDKNSVNLQSFFEKRKLN